MSEQKVYFKKKCQINRKKRIGAINISKYLRFICKNGKTKIISPGSASLEDIKDVVKNKLVYGKPEMKPKELNILLSNLAADHLGVVSDTGRVMKKTQPQNALIHDVTDSFEALKGADVLVLGGSLMVYTKAIERLFRGSLGL